MATFPDSGHTNRHVEDPAVGDESVVERSRSCVCQRTVGENSLPSYGPVSSVNRLVRTRMLGWCGEEERKTLPYPIISRFRQIKRGFYVVWNWIEDSSSWEALDEIRKNSTPTT